MPEPELLIEVTDEVGRLTLNRPGAINALTLDMLRGLDEVLRGWLDDDRVGRVELAGAGERGFCSGADVRELRSHLLAGGSAGPFFALEYGLDALIAAYPKPITARMTGITMGGGLGLCAHASERIVTAGSRLAMPETIIGLYPDVGVLYELSRAPGELGTHLALTGDAVGPSDAVLVGLADRIDGPADEGLLAGARSWIDACYTGDDPARIVAALEGSEHPDARRAGATLRLRSPLSVCVTLAAIRRAAALDSVAAVLAQDGVLAPRMAEGPDFREGVRAQLVDKDRAPRWRHARIEDVTAAEVAAVFA